ncbi:hypothetical protein D3C84_425670 [compost metagenome]
METHQTADIAGTEPWLVFKEEGMEREVMAGKDCGDVWLKHGQPPEPEAYFQQRICR